MLTLGSLAFATPWALGALAALPVLWWLLRVTPPAPKRTSFPPLRILRDLVPRQETPAHTPWWLLALRLLIAALLIFALAQPLWNPQGAPGRGGALVLAIDDGWTAAPGWDRKIAVAADAVAAADRAARPVLLVTTAMPVGGQRPPPSLVTAGEAKTALAALKPKPWPGDRPATMAAFDAAPAVAAGEAIWIGDGIDADDAYSFAERLLHVGPVTAIMPETRAKALLPPAAEADGLRFRILRAGEGPAETVWLKLTGDQGNLLGREPVTIAEGASSAEARVDLPAELRNRLTRAELEPDGSAGAVVLLDERWRRRPVGLVSGQPAEARQPLLSDLHYLDRALSPFTEIRTGSIDDLLQRDIAVIVLADVGRIAPADEQALRRWIDRGGVLLRFAGPHLATQGDGLLPVRLRQGDRQLGGAMSWSQPAKLAAFNEQSPFAGLAVPGDVTVERQVLAEPDLTLPERTWARLDDGTPLVTGEKIGRGHLVLVHTSANADWSTLALSGLFVDMLRRVVALSQGVAGADGNAVLPPLSLLDGFGRGGASFPAAKPIPARDFAKTRPSPTHPPGFYGSEDTRRALNATGPETRLTPIGRLPADVVVKALGEAEGTRDLGPYLLAGGLLLFLVDFLIGLALRGLLRGQALRRSAAGLLVIAALAAAGDARAQRNDNPRTPDEKVMAAALDLRLAHVLTGDGDIDEMSHAGMIGLTDVLWRRTSIEAASPFGIDLERDDISVYPFLYWPMTASQPVPSDKALAQVDKFMKTGGLILFDTRDGGLGGTTAPGARKLREILSRLDMPPLMVVPPDHVLTKAFYLIQDFPGRYVGSPVWVERFAGGANDGVSAVVIGDNDWASAWAVDAAGRPMAAVIPGGERQREIAYRFGVNLLMYTLTGNYKADQVHVPALLERLGQ